MKFNLAQPTALQPSPIVASVNVGQVVVDFDAQTVSFSADDGVGPLRSVRYSFPLPTAPYDLAAYIAQQLGGKLGTVITPAAVAVAVPVEP